MSSVFLLIPLALGMFAVAACMFVWAVRNRQFEDLDAAASRVLFDDDPAPSSSPDQCRSAQPLPNPSTEPRR